MDFTHHFLLSMPQMQDSHFAQSLIYILEHDTDGAWGVVINQALDMSLAEVFQQLGIQSTNDAIKAESVYRGGPVNSQHGLVLHEPGIAFESTRQFVGGIALSSSLDVLKAVAAGEEPQNRRVLLGHAGWGPGQLEQEMLDNAWLSCEANLDIIFHTPVTSMRQAVADLLGVNLSQFVGQAGHA